MKECVLCQGTKKIESLDIEGNMIKKGCIRCCNKQSWITKYNIKRLQKRVIKMETMKKKLTKWIINDKKQIKELMNNE